MIYRFTFFIVFSLYAFAAFSQPGNLVENPGFEERSACITNDGSLEHAPPWFNPTGASPDLFHECAVILNEPCPYPENPILDPWALGVPTNFVGCQEPRTGIGYAGGLFMSPGVSPNSDWREYLGISLSQSLIEGETYLVRFYVSLSERSARAIYAIQVAFRTDSISIPNDANFLDIEPQLTHSDGDYVTDKENWTEISWEYTATGTEQYMYIGNFQSNSVIDTIYALPDSIDPEDHYAAYYYIDDVYVGSEALSTDDSSDSMHFDIWPNPAGEFLVIETNSSVKEFSIFSAEGKLVRHFPTPSSSSEFRVNLGDLSRGCYLLTLTNNVGFRSSKKFVKR